MNYKEFIIIVPGEPNSVFLEIFFKSIRKIKIKNPIIIIASVNLIKLQMKKLKFKRKIKVIQKDKLKSIFLNNDTIKVIDIDYSTSKAFEKISIKSNRYIKIVLIQLDIIKKYKFKKFINGPINKTLF